MSIYQFLIAVRSEGAQLTDAEGETTRYTTFEALYLLLVYVSFKYKLM